MAWYQIYPYGDCGALPHKFVTSPLEQGSPIIYLVFMSARLSKCPSLLKPSHSARPLLMILSLSTHFWSRRVVRPGFISPRRILYVVDSWLLSVIGAGFLLSLLRGQNEIHSVLGRFSTVAYSRITCIVTFEKLAEMKNLSRRVDKLFFWILFTNCYGFNLQMGGKMNIFFLFIANCSPQSV